MRSGSDIPSDNRQPIRTVQIDGFCPFLTCLEEGPHEHDVCPACDAVRYGNMFCPTCVGVINAERAAHGFTDPLPVFEP